MDFGCFKGQRGRQGQTGRGSGCFWAGEGGRAGQAAQGWVAPHGFESSTGLLVLNKSNHVNTRH